MAKTAWRDGSYTMSFFVSVVGTAAYARLPATTARLALATSLCVALGIENRTELAACAGRCSVTWVSESVVPVNVTPPSCWIWPRLVSCDRPRPVKRTVAAWPARTCDGVTSTTSGIWRRRVSVLVTVVLPADAIEMCAVSLLQLLTAACAAARSTWYAKLPDPLPVPLSITSHALSLVALHAPLPAAMVTAPLPCRLAAVVSMRSTTSASAGATMPVPTLKATRTCAMFGTSAVPTSRMPE